VYVVGSNADQNSVAPEVTLGSVMIDLPRAFLEVAREVKGGAFQARVVEFDAKSDVVRLVINPAVRARIPARALARVDSVSAQIHAGTFTAQSR
jgi:basic membrane lipoprotein Med (substrate-binding protein (PBP1-ABC) superfamily)